MAAEPPPLGFRTGWAPSHDDDYGDGGAFPEIAVEQHPSGIGKKRPLVPLTFVSGFLGSGKTTMLKHVLENQEGLRVGVVVNDVAEVNIDAKLLARRQMADEDEAYEDTVELENGCACCTAGPDLMDSILKLIRLSIRRDIIYDRVVVEMSGVSEPRNLRDDFQDSKDTHQVFKYVDLQTMLTVVDSSHFLELYTSKQDIKQLPDLVMTEKDKQSGEAHIDNERRVVDLLVEMIECADYVVLNKSDRVSDEHRARLDQIAQSLNPSATMVSCSWGKVPLDVVLGAPQGVGVCKVDDHTKEDIKRAVATYRHGGLHSKRMAAGPAEDDAATSVFGHVSFSQLAPASTSHGSAGVDSMPGPRGLREPKKQRTSSRQQTSAAQRFGISTFVYSRRRPFHPGRLVGLLNLLPVKVDSAGQTTDTWQLPAALSLAHLGSADGDANAPGQAQGADRRDAPCAPSATEQGPQSDAKAIMHAVIRSKGFVWLANAPQKMNYWSHAGHFFSLEYLHDWWVSTPIYEWPRRQDEIVKILDDFVRPDQCASEGGVYAGDRRQEIVYIGIDMDQSKIEMLLDRCLLTDAEMAQYHSQEECKNLVELDWACSPAKIVGVHGYTEPPPEEDYDEDEEEEEAEDGKE